MLTNDIEELKIEDRNKLNTINKYKQKLQKYKKNCTEL